MKCFAQQKNVKIYEENDNSIVALCNCQFN